jgi:uncharacterized protein YkwD
VETSRRAPALLVLGCVAAALALSACDAFPRAAGGSNIDEAPAFDAAYLEQRLFDLVNEQRAAHGLEPLGWDDPLANVALAHSKDMAARGYFDHVNPDGDDVNDRAARSGLECRRGGRTGLGENLALTPLYSATLKREDGSVSRYEWRTLDEVAAVTIEGWMASPGHRRNILDPGFSEHGIGVAIDSAFRVYVTDNFC